MSKFSLITKGLLKENPTFVLVLGMCPTLATTTSAMNGLEMGLATMFVLILSNIVISLIAPVVPDKVHIPVYIVVIATFVTVLQLLMQAQKLLEEEKSVSEVTYDTGFCDQSHLDRCFHKIVGLTPKEYKDAVKK